MTFAGHCYRCGEAFTSFKAKRDHYDRWPPCESIQPAVFSSGIADQFIDQIEQAAELRRQGKSEALREARKQLEREGALIEEREGVLIVRRSKAK